MSETHEAPRETAWIRQDDRCRLPFRVMVTWECYDCSPVEEVARFARFTDAREFVRAKCYRWLSQNMKHGLRDEIPDHALCASTNPKEEK